MSLILEALRKSEAERRRGQAPGLFVEQVAVPSRRRAKTPAWTWALMGLLAAVLVAWAWREFATRSPAAVDPTATGPQPTEAAGAASDSVPPVPTSANPAVPHVGPADPGLAASPEPRTPPDPQTQTAIPAPPAPSTASANTPRTTVAATAETSAVVSPPAAAVPPRSGSPAPGSSTGPVDTNAPTPTPDTAATSAPENEFLPRLSELTGDERSYLPALKLTMHVYAEDPAQRFVILDGRRLREGDRAADGVALEAIRRDGLVLSVNGRRVLLARP